MESIDIKDKVWNGRLNVRIVFGAVEYLARVYRHSYWALEFGAIVAYFARHDAAVATSPVWLEYDGVPVKWNLPVGVLHDYLHLPTMAAKPDAPVWTLTLRHQAYPGDQIMPFVYRTAGGAPDYVRALQEVVVNHLKQSTFVLNGSSKAVMAMSEADSKALWHAVVSHNLYQYDRINKSLLPALKCQRVPVKVYVCGATDVIQAPLAPTASLGEVMASVLPALFSNGIFASPYIHGVDMTAWLQSPECGILDLWKVFKHLDNFLYITVLATSRSEAGNVPR